MPSLGSFLSYPSVVQDKAFTGCNRLPKVDFEKALWSRGERETCIESFINLISGRVLESLPKYNPDFLRGHRVLEC